MLLGPKIYSPLPNTPKNIFVKFIHLPPIRNLQKKSLKGKKELQFFTIPILFILNKLQFNRFFPFKVERNTLSYRYTSKLSTFCVILTKTYKCVG